VGKYRHVDVAESLSDLKYCASFPRRGSGSWMARAGRARGKTTLLRAGTSPDELRNLSWMKQKAGMGPDLAVFRVGLGGAPKEISRSGDETTPKNPSYYASKKKSRTM